MNREELKTYLIKVIDSLTDEELQGFKIYSPEPDLLSITKEIASLSGEVKKMNNISLKINNNIQAVIDNTNQIAEESETIDDKTPEILSKIIEQDELTERTLENFNKIIELTPLNFFKFTKQFSGWKEGYNIFNEKWKAFIKSSGLKTTGNAGEMFDPNFHEAIGTVSNDNQPDNVIVECQEVGYLYKNSLVRQAKVTVNKR